MAGNLEIGAYFGAVEFGDPRGGGGISVPVRASIVGDLTIVPSLVRFVESGHGFQPATILVLNRTHGDKSTEGNLRIVEDDCGLALKRLETVGGGHRRYQKYHLTVKDPQIFREKQPSEIHLAVDDAGESCQIKLLVVPPVNVNSRGNDPKSAQLHEPELQVLQP